jgi:hypothetical protein
MSSGRRREDWKVIKGLDNIEIFDDHEGKNRRNFYFPVDVRSIHLGDAKSVKIAYWTIGMEHNHHEMQTADLFYSEKLDALYIVPPIQRIIVEGEFGLRHQKNWSPFIYESQGDDGDASGASGGKNKSELLFIYSIFNQRILRVNESAARLDSFKGERFVTVSASTVAETWLLPEDKVAAAWKFGQVGVMMVNSLTK